MGSRSSNVFTARSVAQSSLSYLLTYALVAFSQYSIFPWVLVYFRSRKYESWAQVTIVFGLLVSTLNGGAFLGQVVAGRFAQLSGFYYSCLAACLITSYVALAFVSRFFFIISCFWMIGLSGGMLTCFSLSIDGRFQRKTVTQPVDQSIICFAFSTLLTAFLYDNHADAEFPCFYLAVTMLVASALAIGYIVMINRMTPKPPRAISSTSKELGMPTIKLSTNDADLEGAGSDYSGSVPPNFLSSCQGNLDKARRMYGKTQAWRAKYDVDNIFSMPQPSFHTVLKYYPHAIHGISLDGCTVCYELLGKGRAKELKATGISIDELVWHFNLRNEFVFRQLQAPETLAKAAAAAVPGAITPTRFPYSPDPALAPHVLPAPVPRLMTVIDVSGISMYSITTDVLAFIQRSGEIIDNYYPEQVARLVVCRAPRWFSAIWSVIARVLPEAVQKKVDILYDAQGLDKYIHPSLRPREYGGTDVDLGQSPDHLAFLALAEEWKRAAAARSKTKDGVNGAKADGSAEPFSSDAAHSSAVHPLGHGAAGSGSSTSIATATSAATTGPPGWMGWLRNRFQRGGQEAYLGGKNSYRYNALTGRWELDAGEMQPSHGLQSPGQSLDPEDGRRGLARSQSQGALPHAPQGSPRPGLGPHSASVTSFLEEAAIPSGAQNYGKDHLEEHGLVLAIQAAHYASKVKRSTSTNFSSAQAGQAFMQSTPIIPEHNAYGLGAVEALTADPSAAGTEAGGGEPMTKISAHIFLAVLAIFVVTSCLQVSLLTLLPVWLASPLRSGGLGYGVRDLALLMSSTAVVVLLVHAVAQTKMDSLLRSSPVRALRIGAGVMFLSVVALPRFIRMYTVPIEDIIHHHLHEESDLLDQAAFRHSPMTALQSEKDMLAQLGDVLPSITLSAFFVPAMLIASMICASHLCRKAASIMLHLSLTSTFSSPATIRNALNALVDILGPFLSALLSSIIYSARLKFPMDSSFFLPLGACSILLAYMASLFLVVQFRGDFGVMSDYQELRALLWRSEQSQPTSTLSLSSPSSDSVGSVHRKDVGALGGLHQRSGGGAGSILASLSRETSGGSQSVDEEAGSVAYDHLDEDHVLTIPLGDLNLLFSGVGSHGYGHKLHNLKDDFKDV